MKLLAVILLIAAASQNAYQRGEAALNAKRYSEAEQDLAEAELAAPGKTDALALRAKALINLERFSDAEHCLRQYLQAHSDSADASYLLAYVLFREDRARDSLAEYTAAARLQRPRADDFKIVGLDYVLLNDIPDAIKWLQRSVAENPKDAEAVYHLGRAFYVQNSFDKAIVCFERALQLDPNYVKSENNLGLAYEGKNRLDLAEAAYRKAIAMENQTGTRSDQPFLNLADLLSRSGHNAEALTLLENADGVGGKSQRSAELRGRIFFAENRFPEAEAELRAAIASQPQDGALHYLLGRVLKREGKAGDAEKEFAQTRALLGTHSSAPVQTLEDAAALIQRNELAAAEAELQPLLKEQPEDPVALNLLGLVRVKQKKPDDAETLFREAIATGHPLAGPHINLALLHSSERPIDALNELQEALKIAPGNQQAESLVQSIAKQSALKALQSGNSNQAIAIAMKARQAAPKNPEILYDFGMVALEAGLYPDAQAALEQSLALRPGYQEARYALARVYLDESLAQQAEQQMRKYLDAKTDDASAWYGLGYILVAEQKLDEAKSAFDKSLALEPNQTESLFQLGEIALEQGHTDAARGEFTKVLARAPQHAGALTEMGVMAFRTAKLEEAKNDLERAIASAPSYQKAHYYYALTLTKTGDKAQADREFALARQLQKKHTTNARLALPAQ